MRFNRLGRAIGPLALTTVVLLGSSALAFQSPVPSHVHRWYQHIFVVMLENHAENQIIGNPLAPQLNALAHAYGLATHYYGITHPSEANYIAIIGGSNFGVHNDGPYTANTINALNLADELEAVGLTWRSYQQGLPYQGYTGLVYPTKGRPLYLSKHDPFLNFADVQRSTARLRNIVPDTQLVTDLRSGNAPNFGLIVPDLCHDMHGQWPMCRSAHAPGDVRDKRLIRNADTYVESLVRTIMASPMWSQGNNAIVITYDENDFIASHDAYDSAGGTGCCGVNPGGGHIPTIVITSHGPHGVHDATPYNHYALLRTIQVALHVGCLQHTCDTANAKVMHPLFATHP